MKKKRIIVFSNHVAFFLSHRINIFYEAQKRGYDFLLITGRESSKNMERESLKKIKKLKIRHKVFNFNSYSLNILNDIRSIFQILMIVGKLRPDIFHTVAPKPNLYGGLISKVLNLDYTVISFSGMGFLYTGNLSLLNYIKKIFFEIFLRIIFTNKKICIIVQNKSDYQLLKNKFNIKNNIKLIKGGSGIHLDKFLKIKRIKNKNVVFSARLVLTKGIGEFIIAAKILKRKYPEWNFLIYGTNDYKSNDNFNIKDFSKEIKEGIIEYKGYTTNLLKILKNTEIFCLPSYREGFPKSILEASASGIPCVVSNSIGCRESVINNKTGLLFKNKDHNDLIKKISFLIENPKKRSEFSKNARNSVKKFASIKTVTKEIFKIYEFKR